MKIGDYMPSFTLTDQFGKDLNNAERAGSKTVIYAYPKDSKESRVNPESLPAQGQLTV